MAGRHHHHHHQKGLSKPCILLIVVAGMERFAFKGVSSNLVTYLTDVMSMSNSSAAKTVNNWIGLTSIMPLLVAPLADFLWDRYSTIIFSSFIYVAGLVAVTSTAFKRIWSSSPTDQNQITTTNPLINSNLFLFWSLSLISLGQGGYNPSLQAFAADQLEDELDNNDEELPLNNNNKELTSDHEDLISNQQSSPPPLSKKNQFFSCWYVGICGGSLLGVSLMGYIQDYLGWGIGFIIPTMVMILSILMLSSGTRFYTYKFSKSDEEKETPFDQIVRGVKDGVAKIIVNCGCISSSGSSTSHVKQNNNAEMELQKESLHKFDIAAASFNQEEKTNNNPTHNTILQNVKVVLRLLPIWTTLLIFAVIFQQPVTFFTKQGMAMNKNIFGTSFKIPPATLQSTITVSILILMPLYDKLFIPLTRMITPKNKGITVTQRMGIGMLLSTLAMIIAALVEKKRLKLTKHTGGDHTNTNMNLSIFWLLPQYILLGISDIFTVIGMQEFFYSEVPDKMRTTGLALNTSVYGVGSFMSAALIELVEVFTRSNGDGRGWFSDDMREARIDKYYWLLAVLSAVSMVLYALFCTCHNSLNTGDDHDECSSK